MMYHASPGPSRAAALVYAACACLLIAAAPVVTRAQETRPDDATTSDRDWAYPTRGPTREQARSADPNRPLWQEGPWFGSVAAGLVWFDGDNLSGSADFAADLRLGFDLSNEASLVASYTFALAETEVPSSGGGSVDEETHDIHILALGVDLQADVTHELRLFIEPRVGVLFGSDADVAPVGMLSGGVALTVVEGTTLRLAVTGLVTDSDINTSGEDANLDTGVMATLGLAFEF